MDRPADRPMMGGVLDVLPIEEPREAEEAPDRRVLCALWPLRRKAGGGRGGNDQGMGAGAEQDWNGKAEMTKYENKDGKECGAAGWRLLKQ